MKLIFPLNLKTTAFLNFYGNKLFDLIDNNDSSLLKEFDFNYIAERFDKELIITYSLSKRSLSSNWIIFIKK